jgi:photosystem II stability/assembly factor-like uncharacterized protein
VSVTPAPRAAPLRIGGGGYITGLALDPLVPDRLLARCDVGGVFLSEDGGRTWRAVNRGMVEAHHHMVQSVTMSPLVPGLAFRCSGDARGGRRFGTIHRTRDGGASWHAATDHCDFFGNGPTRMMGEVIACSPSAPDVVYVGAYSTGAWRSDDGGTTWHHRGLAGARITVVAAHPHVAERLYVATCSDRVFSAVERGSRWAHEDTAAKCRRYSDSVRGDRGALVVSPDGGANWTEVLDGPDVTDLVFGSDGMLFATTLHDGVLRSKDDGRTWSAAMTGLPADASYHALTIDADGTLYVAPDARPGDDALAPVPVYTSEDHGARWRLVRLHGAADLTRYPPYMSERHAGWAISTLRACPRVPGRLFLCNWYGVARSDDGGLTWDANHFDGIETTCAEAVVADPHDPATIHVTLADHRPNVSRDAGRSFEPMRVARPLPGGASDSTASVASRQRPGLVLAGLTRRGSAVRPAVIVRSVDGGATGAPVHAFGDGLFVQALVEDARVPGRFHAFLDGAVADGAGLYRSDDEGRRWHRRDAAFAPHLRTFPHRAAWIDAELMPVVGYQVKNACGTNRHLCVDPHRDGTVYVGEWTEGLFRIDADDAVVSIGDGLPFGADPEAALAVVRSDPARPDALWAGFTNQGLWRTLDGGERWSKVYPCEGEAPCHVTSLALADDGKTVAIAGEPLARSRARSGVWVSFDGGTTWHGLDDGALGALRWKGIALDRDATTLYGVTCGSGGYRFELGSLAHAGRLGRAAGAVPAASS